MNTKKALYLGFLEKLSKLDNTSKIACIIDDVYAEDTGIPTDEPFNVISSEVNQESTEYTLDVTHSSATGDSIVVSKDQIQLYYNASDILETMISFFEAYIDVGTVEDIYDLYEKLEELDEYDEFDSDEYDKFNEDFEPGDY